MPASLLTLLMMGFAVAFPLSCLANDSAPTPAQLAAIRGAGKLGAGFAAAQSAAAELRHMPADQLPLVLDALSGAGPIAENWIRGLVFDVVRRAEALPLAALSDYALDQTNNATGRGLAMELIQASAPDRAAELISQCLNDPGLPLREMAVDQVIAQADGLAQTDQAAAMEAYRVGLAAARHPQQLEKIVTALRRLGDQQVSIATALQMIGQWRSVAPFDNGGGVGFDTPYPPEQSLTDGSGLDFAATYQGKHGPIGWKPLLATGDQGSLDLAAAYDREKGAVCYLYSEFDSSAARPAQLRLSSKNANKAWVNGEQVMANEVYHSGFMLDQYVADIQLRQGTNQLLLKICQNEQDESWAQDWQFQCRITDASGKALSSGD